MHKNNKISIEAGKIVFPAQYARLPVPDREWFVEGLIPHKTVTLLTGDGGLGKSLLMQQLCVAAATDTEWLGLKTRKCKTFGLFCEDSNSELLRRQSAICLSQNIEPDDCYHFAWLSGNGIDPVLMDFSSGNLGRTTDLFESLCEFLDCWEPELIIIDTAADTFAGDEIKRIQVRNFINRCLNELAQKYNATVILTAHPSVSGMREGSGLSGSTAWNNSVRSRLYLTRPEGERNSNVRVLQMKKSNYGSTEPEIRIVWQNGAFSAVENTVGQNPEDRASHDEAAYLFALLKLQERGQRALVHRNQANYGPKLMKTIQETHGVSVTRLEEAQDRLMNRGIVANVQDEEGPKSKRKWQIKIINQVEADKIMDLKLF